MVAGRTALLLEAAGLVVVLGFVASVGYLPHADGASQAPVDGPGLAQLGTTYWRWLGTHEADDYEHTVHVDENVHWVAMAAMQRADSLRHEELFFGFPEGPVSLSLRGLIHERGFHVAVLSFEEMTGIAWHEVFRFLPAAWLAGTALLVWAALRPWPGALAAAALVALVPTSLRFLGPGFLVPIGFGLAWMAATMLLVPPAMRSGRAAAVLMTVIAWAFFIHLIAGFAALLFLLCALPFAREHRRGLALLGGIALVPAAWLLDTFGNDVSRELSAIAFLPRDPVVFDQLGIPFLLLWAVGVALVLTRPPHRARLVVQGAALASLVCFLFLVLHFATDLGLYALYDRWHPPFALFAAVVVAHALVVAGEALGGFPARLRKRAGLRRPSAWRGGIVTFSVAGLFLLGTVDAGLAHHVREPYYHVLDDADWAAFQWAAAHVNDTYEVFLTHPWKAPIFSALTGKRPHTWLTPGSPPVRGEDYDAYRSERHADGAWLVERDVSLTIDPQAADGEGFRVTGPLTSQLDWAEAQELARLRGS